MSLFQNSVLEKYLQHQDQSKLAEAYKKFIALKADGAILLDGKALAVIELN